ncbi:uncharacterized protein LOC106051143 [Biomphalaria glabrata]|uniref:Uncharacterized protein LOC106051143 n=1 Tax=Biomphalaria glabrata TaxID=6526 RepID=A0A9U8DVC0_BIOGL|nr:uncharacterized protein LOC106051143 [Biomphalaria glabrata]
MHFVNCLIIVLLLSLSQLSLESPNNEGDNRARLLRFVSLIAGSYYDGKENPLLRKTVLPVQANAFYPSLTIYLEDNEKPEPPFRQLLVLRERPDGYIAITPYFFPYDNK